MAGRLDGVDIVIVDDDKDVLEALDTALKSEGAVTRCVSDGNEAVRVCQDDPPELVVLDMMLPGRSGFLVLEKIKGHPDSPMVIMVTANEGKRHQAYAESLGVDKYLLKPVPLERLITVCEELVAKLDAQDEADGLAFEEDGAGDSGPRGANDGRSGPRGAGGKAGKPSDDQSGDAQGGSARGAKGR
ncbi:MAG: response regulator [Phycisphaeraceae bacterium]|nr:response regulator [Phycisphaeraceae bacterium]